MLVPLPTNLRILIHGVASFQARTEGQTLRFRSPVDHCQFKFSANHRAKTRPFLSPQSPATAHSSLVRLNLR